MDLQEDLDEEYEDFDDEEVEEIEERKIPEIVVRSSSQEFTANVKILAKKYIEDFFKDKMLHCGGKIPKSFLNSDRRVSMVMNYDIIMGIDHAYSALEKTIPFEELERARNTGETTSDIVLVNETLYMLSQSGVPQQFAGGMMILYLEFIEGVEVGPS